LGVHTARHPTVEQIASASTRSVRVIKIPPKNIWVTGRRELEKCRIATAAKSSLLVSAA
jgi:hypothetical protein